MIPPELPVPRMSTRTAGVAVAGEPAHLLVVAGLRAVAQPVGQVLEDRRHGPGALGQPQRARPGACRRTAGSTPSRPRARRAGRSSRTRAAMRTRLDVPCLTGAARARTVEACDACSPACSSRPRSPLRRVPARDALERHRRGPGGARRVGLRARRARAGRAPPRHHGALREHRRRALADRPARRQGAASRSPTARPRATAFVAARASLEPAGGSCSTATTCSSARPRIRPGRQGRGAGHRRRAAPDRDRGARGQGRLRRRRHRPRRDARSGARPRSCAASRPCPWASAGTTTARPTPPPSCAARRPASFASKRCYALVDRAVLRQLQAAKHGARPARSSSPATRTDARRRHRGARPPRARLRDAEAPAARRARCSKLLTSAGDPAGDRRLSRRARRPPTTPPRRRCSCSRTDVPDLKGRLTEGTPGGNGLAGVRLRAARRARGPQARRARDRADRPGRRVHGVGSRRREPQAARDARRAQRRRARPGGRALHDRAHGLSTAEGRCRPRCARTCARAVDARARGWNRRGGRRPRRGARPGSQAASTSGSTSGIPSGDDLDELAETLELHRLARDDLGIFGQRPKADDYPGHTLIVLFGATHDEDSLVEVHAVVARELAADGAHRVVPGVHRPAQAHDARRAAAVDGRADERASPTRSPTASTPSSSSSTTASTSSSTSCSATAQEDVLRRGARPAPPARDDAPRARAAARPRRAPRERARSSYPAPTTRCASASARRRTSCSA